MRFPNAYHGVKRLITTELLIGFFTALTLLFPTGLQPHGGIGFLNGLFTCVILALAVLAVVTRMMALTRVSQDDDTYLPAMKYTFAAFLFFLFNTLLLPFIVSALTELENNKSIVMYKELLIGGTRCLPVVMQAAALYCFLSATQIIIFGTGNVALRAKNLIVYDRGNPLKWRLTVLFFASLLASVLKAALPAQIVSAPLFRFLIPAVLVAGLVVVEVFFLIYLRQAEEMLLGVKSKEFNIWTGVARELLSEAQETDVVEEEEPAIPDTDARYWPVEALNAPSKWVDDVERFFKWELHRDEAGEAEEAQKQASDTYVWMRRLLIAEALCLVNGLFAFFFASYTNSIPIFPWYTSLFGKIACYLQWSAFYHASLERPWSRSVRKMLAFVFWIAFGLFLMPFYSVSFGFDDFSFSADDAPVFGFFSYILRVLWVLAPVLVTPRVLSALRSLAGEKRNCAEFECWKKLSICAYPVFFLLFASLFVEFILFKILICVCFAVVFGIVLFHLIRIVKPLRRGENTELFAVEAANDLTEAE